MRNDNPALAALEDAAAAQADARSCIRVLLARLEPHLADDDISEFRRLIAATWLTTRKLSELRPLAQPPSSNGKHL